MTHEQGERRRYQRSKRGFQIIGDETREGTLTHVDNISGNGVLCHTLRPIPLMTRMQVLLELPEPVNQEVNVEGVVVRCEADAQRDEEFKVAILFTKIDEDERDAIIRFVEHDLAQSQDHG